MGFDGQHAPDFGWLHLHVQVEELDVRLRLAKRFCKLVSVCCNEIWMFTCYPVKPLPAFYPVSRIDRPEQIYT